MTPLTPARRRALEVVAAGETRGVEVRISSRTTSPDSAWLGVSWQTARWLVAEGLAIEELGPRRDGLRLTPAGRMRLTQERAERDTLRQAGLGCSQCCGVDVHQRVGQGCGRGCGQGCGASLADRTARATDRPGDGTVSVEVVHDDHGGIWVITGTPTDGYHVHPVGNPIATYDRKYEARRAIRDGNHTQEQRHV